MTTERELFNKKIKNNYVLIWELGRRAFDALVAESTWYQNPLIIINEKFALAMKGK